MPERRVRGGLLLPLVLIAAGLIILLENLGAIEPVSWRAVFRFWPVLLIVVGIDLVVGRSSFRRTLSALLAVVVLLCAGFVAFRAFAPDAWILEDQSVRVALDGASRARVSLTCDACSIHLEETSSPDVLLEGEIATRRFDSLSQRTTRTQGSVEYELTAGRDWLPPWPRRSAAPEWRLAVSSAAPLDLAVSGENVDLDLETLPVGSVDATSSEGTCELVLSAASTAQYYVAAEVLTVRAPEEIGVRVELPGLRTVDVPTGYAQTGSSILSGNWEVAPVRATVFVRPGVRAVTLEPLPNSAERTDAGT
jgi:hypothetical protein